ncbi:hypothetical protein MRX96_048501 [Rhipicephalus microplus]
MYTFALRSGAKYVVLTGKHHEGFTLWPSDVSWNWNAKDVGPHRDLVGDLADAVRRRAGLRFGVYHSMMDWYHPLYLADKASGFESSLFPPAKAIPELMEIVERYEPDIVWSDGEWEAPDTYWNSTAFLAWLYNDSPCVLQPHKWENCLPIDQGSWGYRRDANLSDYRTIGQLLDILASTISCNGNLLINVGPTKDGIISPIFEERLTQLGQWLSVNGEAVYGSKPWKYQNDTATPNVWYTAKDDVVYVYVMRSLHGHQFSIQEMLPNGAAAQKGTVVSFPKLTPDQLPTPWAWVLKVEAPM